LPLTSLAWLCFHKLGQAWLRIGRLPGNPLAVDHGIGRARPSCAAAAGRLSERARVALAAIVAADPGVVRGAAQAAMEIAMPEGFKELWEDFKIPLGPNKGEIVVQSRVQTKEEQELVEGVASGTYKAQDVVREHGERFAGTGNGWQVFPSSIFLAQFLSQCPSFVKDKVVVEVGCGMGVAGIAAAKAGAKEVLMLDKDPTVLGLAARNAVDNGVADRVKVSEVDWTDRATWPKSLKMCDIIIGGDVLYNEAVIRGLVDFFDEVLTDQGRAIVVDPRERYYRNYFREQCEEADFEYKTMLETPELFLVNILRLRAPDA